MAREQLTLTSPADLAVDLHDQTSMNSEQIAGSIRAAAEDRIVLIDNGKILNAHAWEITCENGTFSLATRMRFSCPLRISSIAANCPVRLMDSRTSVACAATSKPLTRAVPLSALSSVVLPARSSRPDWLLADCSWQPAWRVDAA